jgi:hypothetical protein
VPFCLSRGEMSPRSRRGVACVTVLRGYGDRSDPAFDVLDPGINLPLFPCLPA